MNTEIIKQSIRKTADINGAIKITRQALKKYPQSVDLLAKLSELYMIDCQDLLSLKYAKKAYLLDSDNIFANRVYAASSGINGSNLLAICLYKKIASNKCRYSDFLSIRENKSLQIDAMFGLAYSYRMLDDIHNAIIWAQKHIASRKRGIFSQWKKQEVAGDINAWKTIKSKIWDSNPANFLLSQCKDITGSDLKFFLKYKDISDSRILFFCASNLFRLDRYKESIAAYRKISRYSAKRIMSEFGLKSIKQAEGLKNDIRLRIAKCCYCNKDYEKSIQYIKNHISQMPLPTENKKGEAQAFLKFVSDIRQFTNHCKLYDKFADQGNWSKAIECLKKAIKLNQTHHWVWTQFARSYLNVDEDEKALESAKKAYSLAANCPETLFYYGYCLEINGKIAEAKKIFQKIINIGIETLSHGECGEGLRYGRGYYADALFRLGRCCQKEGKKASAEKYFNRHLSMRGSGTASIFTKRTVLHFFDSLKGVQ